MPVFFDLTLGVPGDLLGNFGRRQPFCHVAADALSLCPCPRLAPAPAWHHVLHEPELTTRR